MCRWFSEKEKGTSALSLAGWTVSAWRRRGGARPWMDGREAGFLSVVFSWGLLLIQYILYQVILSMLFRFIRLNNGL